MIYTDAVKPAVGLSMTPQLKHISLRFKCALYFNKNEPQTVSVENTGNQKNAWLIDNNNNTSVFKSFYVFSLWNWNLSAKKKQCHQCWDPSPSSYPRNPVSLIQERLSPSPGRTILPRFTVIPFSFLGPGSSNDYRAFFGTSAYAYAFFITKAPGERIRPCILWSGVGSLRWLCGPCR